jgi:xylulokinase
VPALADATLLGAALIGGWAAGGYPSAEAALAAVSAAETRVVEPRPEVHAHYQRLYERGYVPMQAPLRALAEGLRA